MWKTIQQKITSFLAAIRVIDVGRPGDGVDEPYFSSGTEIDKPWGDLHEELLDARNAWRSNPMARRVVGIFSAYVVGTDMNANSENEDLKAFIKEFWNHPQNYISLRLEDWCDELTRAGELFITIHPNEMSGVSQLRAIPASRIREVKWKEGDYETELAYRELPYTFGEEAHTTPDYMKEKWWWSPAGYEMQKQAGKEIDPNEPWMMHYAVNKPIGAVRGESDLAPLLSWLRRYNTWLEDRVRLNAAIRAFVWVVHAPQNVRDLLMERYNKPPEPGTIIIADTEETWEAVAPTLNARDASADGRAIRWMLAAGGPGISLTDFGESEDSNLATAKAAGEQRRRFLLRRQSYFAWMLADLIIHAYNRQLDIIASSEPKATTEEVVIMRPDISTEDNFNTANALMSLAESFINLRNITGESDNLKSFLLRLYIRYSEEPITDTEFDKIVAGKPVEQMNPKNPSAPNKPNEAWQWTDPNKRTNGSSVKTQQTKNDAK